VFARVVAAMAVQGVSWDVSAMQRSLVRDARTVRAVVAQRDRDGQQREQRERGDEQPDPDRPRRRPRAAIRAKREARSTRTRARWGGRPVQATHLVPTISDVHARAQPLDVCSMRAAVAAFVKPRQAGG